MPKPLPRKKPKAKTPDLSFERRLSGFLGYSHIAGVDEVGVGCLAGPVVAAAVILSKPVPGLTDSKLLSGQKRESLFPLILENALCYAIESASVQEIDQINILRASQLAMQRAIQKLSIQPKLVLIDGRFLLPIQIPQRALIKGDSRVASISAASILAKVTRDRMMDDWDKNYPGYGFASHKGYSSLEHRKALTRLGPSPLHRSTFHWSPV